MKPGTSVMIAGGGLSGLMLAYLLQQKHYTVTILEASARIGGRIQTISGAHDTPLELGATWLSHMHPNLIALLEALGIEKYPQYSEGISLFQTKSFEPAQQFYIPAAEQPSYRIAGGTQTLVNTLAAALAPHTIQLQQQVTAIRETADGVAMDTGSGDIFHADIAISCIPPQLAAAQIRFTPALPAALTDILPAVQTWMAGAGKFVIAYDTPFWRQHGYSGMLYSHAGMVTEMYDHTNMQEDKYALTGFLSGGAANYSQEVRKEYVLRQLAELLGEQALHPATYADKIWNDPFLYTDGPASERPHQHNGHPLLHAPYMNGRLYFCGTETAQQCPGYMEGAVVAAQRVYEMLLQNFPIFVQEK